MSIFSKIKKARKAGEEHKKAAEQAAEAKPPPAPYKHVPTHAALDALAVIPTTWSREESRAKVAAARQRMSTRLASAPATLHRARKNDEHPLPAARLMYRSQSDLPIDSMVSRSAAQNAHKVPLRSPRNTRPPQSQYQYSKKLSSLKESHTVPAPEQPPVPTVPEQRTYCSHLVASSRSSTTRRKSPLSFTSLEQVEPSFISSSQESKFSSVSSNTSVTSSIKDSLRHHDPSRISKPPVANIPISKLENNIETSSPCGSDENLSLRGQSLPLWRYEDSTAEADSPELVEALPRKTSSCSSLGELNQDRDSTASAVAY